MEKAAPLNKPTQQEPVRGFFNQDYPEALAENLEHTQRLAGIGYLSAGVANELTNPLSIITAACNNLRCELDNQTLDQAFLKYYIDLIERSAEYGVRILEILRNYSLAGDWQMSVTDVEMIVRDSLALVEADFLREANTKIEVDCPDSPHSIVGDHNRLTQVLINLLINAREAMQPDGGTIHLRISNIPIVRPGTNGNGHQSNRKSAPAMLEFSVRDTGHGIAPEIMDALFKPFVSTKPQGQASGLGLFIAREIIDRHQGEIRGENNESPNGGATFTVRLPQQPGPSFG